MSVSPFRVMAVMERASQLEAEGRDIVHMEVGEPDFATPQPIIQAGQKALADGLTHYTNAVGLLALRIKISEFYQQHYGVAISPQRIVITPGASGALCLLSALLLNPGDGVLMADPGYPCNRNFVRLAGAEPQLVAVDESTNFQLNPQLLQQAYQQNSACVWLASPSNPTGTILSKPQLQALCAWAESKPVSIMLDEIYHGLHYQGEITSVLEVSDEAYVINSFSKYFGMTGWRLGWLVAPEEAVPRITILAQNLHIAPSTIAQHAALKAFDAETLEVLEQRRMEFKRRRDYLVPALQELGFDILAPSEGAFYIYAGIDRFSDDSEVFCGDLLQQHGVAITPGADFGDYRNNRYVRFAFTTGFDRLQKAVTRLKGALA